MTILFSNVFFSELLFFILLAICIKTNKLIVLTNCRKVETILFTYNRIDTNCKTRVPGTNRRNTIAQMSLKTINCISTKGQMNN
jgi:hypothetical protein